MIYVEKETLTFSSIPDVVRGTISKEPNEIKVISTGEEEGRRNDVG